ncbi:hypothetical protein EHS25_005311 [Saitozyma podzolica]|uniref:Uncharacterized protein n=1 Tax=Saitozyma podzolica TaxID=1890683 RepID=A0A427XYW2_9TREE|nr:hypothetical protein EHS25_005311 [Saitozyma podzolica]
MINWLVNRAPHIREKQIAMQAEQGKNFVYLRGPRSKLYFTAYMALFTAALVGTNVQLIQYARGKAKKVGE